MRSRPIFKSSGLRRRGSKRPTALTRLGIPERESPIPECESPIPERESPILGLPDELLVMILERLENVTTLASAVETCRTFSLVFHHNSRKIISTIFATICARVQDYNVGELFYQLAFAIHRCFIPRDHIEKALEISWPIFAYWQLDELLLPVAWVLAQSYCIDNRKDAAIKLLTKVWQRKPPFYRPKLKDHPTTPDERPPSYTKVGSLLHNLVGKPKNKSIKVEMEQLKASRNALRVHYIQVNKEGVTLKTKRGRDTIPVFFPPPRLPFWDPYRSRLEVARQLDSHADEDLRRRILRIELVG